MAFNGESFYRAQILTPILSTDSMSKVVVVTKLPYLTSGFVTISPNTENEEIFEYSHSGTPGESGDMTLVKRAINPHTTVQYGSWVSGTDYQVTAYAKPHSTNDAIRCDLNHIHILQKASLDGAAFTGAVTMRDNLTFVGTDKVGVTVKNLTEAQRDALTGVTNGALIYNTTSGTLQKYEGGAWADTASGTTPNASETVAGKVEIATQSEVNAGTDTGGTGATLVVIPSTAQSTISTFYTNKKASQAEAEAGSEDTKYVTSAKAKNAIDYQRPVASNSEAQAGTTSKLVTAAQLQTYSGWNYVAGTTLTLASSASSKSSTTSSTPQKLKEFSFTASKSGTVRLTWTHTPHTVNGDIASTTQAYVNGAGVGTTNSRTSAQGANTVTRDLSVNTGDAIQVYGWGAVNGSTSWYAEVTNVSVTYDFSPNYPTISGSVTVS